MICLPSKDFGYKNVTLFDNMVKGERQWVVAKTCETPERAVQLLDFLSSFEFSRIAHDGVIGSNWDMVDGKATIINEDFIGMNEEETIENSLETGARIFPPVLRLRQRDDQPGGRPVCRPALRRLPADRDARGLPRPLRQGQHERRVHGRHEHLHQLDPDHLGHPAG